MCYFVGYECKSGKLLRVFNKEKGEIEIVSDAIVEDDILLSKDNDSDTRSNHWSFIDDNVFHTNVKFDDDQSIEILDLDNGNSVKFDDDWSVEILDSDDDKSTNESDNDEPIWVIKC